MTIEALSSPNATTTTSLECVSILIPSYNYESYLWKTLESASQQSHADVEIIVCDDRSSDRSTEVAMEFALTDQRVLVFRQSENLGLAGNFKSMYSLARGRYIKYLFSDDLLYPNAVERLVEPLREDDTITLSTSARDIIDEHGAVTSSTPHFADSTVVTSHNAAALLCSNVTNFIGEPTTAIFRRRDIKEAQIGAFCGHDFHWNIDIPTWLTLLEKGKLSYNATVLSQFRQHSRQVSARDIDIALSEWITLIHHAGSAFSLTHEQLRMGFSKVAAVSGIHFGSALDSATAWRFGRVIHDAIERIRELEPTTAAELLHG